MTSKSGCAFGQVSRQMITDMSKDIGEIRKGVDGTRDDIKLLFNHQSNRLPLWATILFTIGGSIITGLIIWTSTH
jgi:hypothetical protein